MAFRLAVVALALGCSLAGCSSCDDDKPTLPPAAAPLPPVPAPDRLVADLIAPTPGRTIGELREAVGGPMLLMPRTLGGSVVNLFGLPLTVVENFDEDLPLVAGVAEDDKGQLLFVAAVHLKSAERLRSQLSLGKEATFDVATDGDIHWLTPKAVAREATLPAQLAVLGHHLLIASGKDAARALGPYLTRTVSRKPVGKEPLAMHLTEHALHSAIARRVSALQQLAKLLPVPAEAAPLLDLDAIIASMTALTEDMGSADVRLVLDAASVRLEAEATPKDNAAAKRLKELTTQSPSALLDLPEDTVAAIAWVETAQGRLERAKDRADRWTEDARDLEPQAKDTLRKALSGLASGRGDRTTLALRCTGAGITGLARGDVADADTLKGALGDLVALRSEKAVRAMLASEGVKLSAKKTRLELVPHDVWRLRLTPDGSQDAGAGEPIDFVYAVADQAFFAAAGMETVPTMQQLVHPDAEHSLGLKAEMKAALARAPEHAWLLAALDPQSLHACLLGKPGGRFATPVLLAARHDASGKAQLRLDVARPLLRLLGKMAMD